MVSAQSLTIMRLHVTIYSTNVDDDVNGKAVHGQLRGLLDPDRLFCCPRGY